MCRHCLQRYSGTFALLALLVQKYLLYYFKSTRTEDVCADCVQCYSGTLALLALLVQKYFLYYYKGTRTEDVCADTVYNAIQVYLLY